MNYNTDTGLDVVFDLFPERVYTITLSLAYTMNVQVEVTVNTRLGNKSKTTSSPVSVL